MSTPRPPVKRILVVEDDYFIAREVVSHVTKRGGEVVGPFGEVDKALAAAEETASLDAAVLDINLHGEMAFVIADTLRARGVQFVFATGYDDTVVPERFASVPRLVKPVILAELGRALGI